MLVSVRTEIAGIEVNHSSKQIEQVKSLIAEFKAVYEFGTDKGDVFRVSNARAFVNALDDIGVDACEVEE